MKDYTLTLNGSIQRLSTALADQNLDIPFESLHLQPDGANANPIYVGSSTSITASSYGVRLPAASGGVPPAPYIFEHPGEGRLRLSQLFVFGTNAEKLHILGIER